MNALWENVSNVDKYMSNRHPTDEEVEKFAQECDKFCKLFPVFFPRKNLTRKMVELSLVLPKFIREMKGKLNTILRFEQEGEHLHQLLNSLENKYKSIYNKEERL